MACWLRVGLDMRASDTVPSSARMVDGSSPGANKRPAPDGFTGGFYQIFK